LMQQRDFTAANGWAQIHLSINHNASVCYIYVNDIYNDRLTMRFFTDMHTALSWINGIDTL
jgi:hypothetical protein